jgi:hypothetical protein
MEEQTTQWPKGQTTINVYDITVLDISSRNHGLKPLEISRDIHGLSVVDNQRLIKRHENFNSYLKF